MVWQATDLGRLPLHVGTVKAEDLKIRTGSHDDVVITCPPDSRRRKRTSKIIAWSLRETVDGEGGNKDGLAHALVHILTQPRILYRD